MTPRTAASATATRSRLASRVGETTLHAKIADRMPVGVVYTTFHHPVTGANVVTTEHSDWATNCPEYKVTAVQVGLLHLRQHQDAAAADVADVRLRDGRLRPTWTRLRGRGLRTTSPSSSRTSRTTTPSRRSPAHPAVLGPADASPARRAGPCRAPRRPRSTIALDARSPHNCERRPGTRLAIRPGRVPHDGRTVRRPPARRSDRWAGPSTLNVGSCVRAARTLHAGVGVQDPEPNRLMPTKLNRNVA